MCQFKKITIKILLLILDIFVLAYKIGKQIILPNKKRKGNILSSLYVFFIGTIEMLFNFEHGFFRLSSIFRQKHIKQGLIIIGAFLFLLSSIEWTGNEKQTIHRTGNSPEQIHSIVENNIFNKEEPISGYSEKIYLVEDYPEYRKNPIITNASKSSIKKYLLVRNIRI